MVIDPYIKSLLRFSPKANDEIVRKEWNKRTKNICKPCWELKYCPYGNLVEQFPLPDLSRNDAIEHNNFLREQLKKNKYKGNRKKLIEVMIKKFRPEDYPKEPDMSNIDKSCNVFGHYCPVFFVNEPFTETNELRNIGRKIKRSIMLRVVRRDNNQCQSCGKILKDNEIEFDHIIPVSKGGSSEEHNIRVLCIDCNRKKTNNVII